MEVKEHQIDKIEPGSIADELGIVPGDFLLAINDRPLEDIFDYHYMIQDDHLTLLVRKQDGEDWEYDIEKNYYDDLGIVFYNGLMDNYKSCTNQCVFCFIDQMPPGMRDTLYFKDDDSRLSFLQGNYITLTNMKESDIDRIIRLHLSPINISVHTTNPELRCRMLHNRFAGSSLSMIRRLYEAQTEMNSQIVLCKGWNDGEELERTIRDLSGYLPYMRSLSIVPVGITKFRSGLEPMEPFSKEDAKKVLDTVHKWQKVCYDKYGIHFVHASDEFYLLAEEAFPPDDVYDGFMQLENGVGMIPLLSAEFTEALDEAEPGEEKVKVPFFRPKQARRIPDKRKISIATGRLAAPLMRKLSLMFMLKYPDTEVQVFEISNRYFGETITVSGLLTGTDLRSQLTGQELGEKLLLPVNMMRRDEEVFLDDMTRSELEEALGVPVHIVGTSGRELLDELMSHGNTQKK